MSIANVIRKLEDKEIKINMTSREVRTAFDYLSEKLKGGVKPVVVLDTNNYRTFLSCLRFSKEYRYELTWNEALRLHSYLRFYLERNKNNKLTVTMSQIRNFPLYGLNVKEIKNV